MRDYQAMDAKQMSAELRMMAGIAATPELQECYERAAVLLDPAQGARAPDLLQRARHHIEAALSLTEENRLALAVQGRALIRDMDAALPEGSR